MPAIKSSPLPDLPFLYRQYLSSVGFLNTPLEQIVDDIQTQSDVSKTSTVPYLTTRIPDSSKELQASEGPASPSIDEFREKLTKWKESTVLKMMDKDVGVIENERADILADKIHEMSSRRKRKMMYIIVHSTAFGIDTVNSKRLSCYPLQPTPNKLRTV